MPAEPSSASPPLLIAGLGWLHLGVSNEVTKSVGISRASEVLWQHRVYGGVAKEYQCSVSQG